jgi:hypothetical protein
MRNLLYFLGTSLVFSVASTALAGEPGKIGVLDFSSAKRLDRQPSVLVSAALSKAGLQKFRELNRTMIGKDVAIEIAGVSSKFKLRESIRGDSLEMGPYSENEAQKVIEAINSKVH